MMTMVICYAVMAEKKSFMKEKTFAVQLIWKTKRFIMNGVIKRTNGMLSYKSLTARFLATVVSYKHKKKSLMLL